MAFADFIDKPASKKITVVEIDAPLDRTWINYQPGIWYTLISPGLDTFEDDFGNTGYWSPSDNEYYNIQSFNVGGELYSEASSIANCIATNKSWYYDTATTLMYAHLDGFNPVEYFGTAAPGAALGFTNQIDSTTNNFYEDVYYEPRLKSIPNIAKKKDSVFFGLLQFQAGGITFDNTDGYFDTFAALNLYGQPVRIKLTFEGLDFSEQLQVYSGKVDDFGHDLNKFTLRVTDARKLLSRKLPVNVFDATTYPSMDSKLIGTPIPIAFGSIVNAPAYRTSAGNWKFCDTTFNAVDATIVVIKEDGTTFSHGGTETDGTFTGSDTTDKLFVTFTVSSITNGLDIIADIIENYEDIAYNATNYDTTEWAAEQSNVLDSGVWIGKGALKSTVDVIEQICTDNQGIFDILADGKFTFRTYDADRASSLTIQQDELMSDPSIDYDSEEYLSSVKISHSRDIMDNDPELYTNSTFESEVYGRYRQYKERTVNSTLTSEADATTLSETIMARSKFIFPKMKIQTKTQHIETKIMDTITYEYKRQDGTVIVPESTWEVQGVRLDLSNYLISLDVKQIAEV